LVRATFLNHYALNNDERATLHGLHLRMIQARARMPDAHHRPRVKYMTALGFILFLLGCIVGLVGDVRFLAITYRHGFGWFFTCLFLPVVGWIFFLFYTKETWRPVALSWSGFIIAGIGYMMGGFDFLK
jgi:hypothetical protein